MPRTETTCMKRLEQSVAVILPNSIIIRRRNIPMLSVNKGQVNTNDGQSHKISLNENILVLKLPNKDYGCLGSMNFKYSADPIHFVWYTQTLV